MNKILLLDNDNFLKAMEQLQEKYLGKLDKEYEKRLNEGDNDEA